jgi:hypothetical protein
MNAGAASSSLHDFDICTVADVFVVEEYRGEGSGKRVDGGNHGLSRKFGFTGPQQPDPYMEIVNPGIHKKMKDSPHG